MASTLAAARLTEAHRLAQSRVGTATMARVLNVWPLLDPEALDQTFARWLRAVVPIVQAHRSTSSRLAANYLATFRTLELGIGARAARPVLAGAAPARALSTSMLVTGPASLKARVARGVPLERAVELGQAGAARAAMRHALNGGRETLLRSIAADDRATGWTRATSGAPCDFCAMLADGAVTYTGEDSASFQAHDGCSCTAEPQFASA